MPPSAASKRFRSATAAVQGRGVASNKKASVTPSITSLVPDVLQSAGPRMSVAAKRNIFMHARAYLNGPSRARDMNERKILVQSVIEGTRLHQKQGETVTSMHEHMVEQQEERRRTEAAEALRLCAAEAAAAEELRQEAEQEYHAANSTLTSVGLLHSQVAKLEALSKSYKDGSLVMTAVSSAQKCVSLLSDLRAQVQDDEELLKYILEAQRTGAESASLLKDLEGEIARMREALHSAKETETPEPGAEEVLAMVGAVYEDLLRLQTAETPGTSSRALDPEVELPESAETAESVAPAEDSQELAAGAEAEAEAEASEVEVVDEAEETQEVESPSEVPEPATPHTADATPSAEGTSLAAAQVPVADRALGLPRLPALEMAGNQEPTDPMAEVVETAPCLPNIGREAAPEAPEVVKHQDSMEPLEPLEPPVEPRVVPPVPVAPSTPKVEKKARRKLIMAPDVRLPALPSRNRKKTADLDWNMEHLNADELDLLNEVITEDGGRSAVSIVCDPKKERLWKEFWGLQDAPRVQAAAAAAAAAAPKMRHVARPPWPEEEYLDLDFLGPRKVRTLPELSVSEQTSRGSGRARVVRP